MKLCRLFRLLFGLSYVICVMSQFSKKKGLSTDSLNQCVYLCIYSTYEQFVKLSSEHTRFNLIDGLVFVIVTH